MFSRYVISDICSKKFFISCLRFYHVPRTNKTTLILKENPIELQMTIITTQNILNQVDGSSTFEFESSNTKVITSITGPIEVSKPRNEKATECHLSINVRPAVGLPTTREVFLETKLTKILNQLISIKDYPRSELQIIIQILKSGEPNEFSCMELSCAINSVYLSLVNANITLNSSFLSTYSCILNNEVILRPNKAQLSDSKCHNISVFSIIDGKPDELIFSDSLGSLNENELFDILHKSSKDIQDLNQKMRVDILETVKNEYVWRF